MIINIEALKQFDDLQIAGKPDVIIEVIDSFLKISKTQMHEIAELVSKKDIVGAAKKAHALKPGALILGAELMGKLCQEIENLEESKNSDELNNLFLQLEKTYTESCQELIEIKLERMKSHLNTW